MSSDAETSTYTGPTKQQVIQQAAQLQLPTDNAAASGQNLPAIESGRRGVNLGLGLPEEANTQPQNRIASPKQMYPDNSIDQ